MAQLRGLGPLASKSNLKVERRSPTFLCQFRSKNLLPLYGFTSLLAADSIECATEDLGKNMMTGICFPQQQP